MSGIFSLIVILVPILMMGGLAIFFIRLFKKTSVLDQKIFNEMASLEVQKKNAVWHEARIISVRAELPSRFNTANRILDLKLEIKNEDGGFKMYNTRWQVDTTVLSAVQPDSVIQVKVNNNLVFPALDGAKIIL
jgi:hypothetical protein